MEKISIEFNLLEDKFNSLRLGKFTFAKISIDEIWLEFRNKWFREGKFTLASTSIDDILFELKSKAIKFLPKLFLAKTSILLISFSSKSNWVNFVNLIEHNIFNPLSPIFLLNASSSSMFSDISVLYFALKFFISLIIFYIFII